METFSVTADTNFAPMGLDAVAIRVGNTCGHDLDAKVAVIEQQKYITIKIADNDNSIVTYAFVLNFFNANENYADFNAFGITIWPHCDNDICEDQMLILLDRLFQLVRRQEFIDGVWDIAAQDPLEESAISINLPIAEWGFHSRTDTPEPVTNFIEDFRNYLKSVNQEIGNLNPSVWEYRNIDF